MAAIVVVSVGRTRRGPLLELEEDYLVRIGRLGPVKRESVPASAARRPEDRRREEAAALAPLVRGGGLAVALDSRGRTLTSAEFGERLAQWRGRGPVTFVVGGPDGFDDAFRGACAESLSLGPMTLPHELALVVLLEQVYRALAAAMNHPYSRH
jgi:23S rRNA (pseudouridine1915-N3)-methyltransferase